jgi:replicative DNA helicase
MVPWSGHQFERQLGEDARRGGDQVTIQELFPQRSDTSPDDRLPPQDLHAEQSVLGGMLLSKDAIADCVEVLRSADFYRPQHEAIFDAVLGLYGRGEPADAITVSDELGKRGDLGRVGGQAYLHQLINSVPTAANAGYYAQIVAERAVLRRLVEAGTKIVQLGYAQGGGDVEDIVNAAQAEVYAVVDKRGGEDYHRLGDILEMTVDEIEVASGKSGEMTGVPTGFTDLDSLTNGLHPGQMIVLAARPAIGKALALDTRLPTPFGWTTMGEVAIGDLLLGGDGRPTRVVAATDVMVDRPCYRVCFSDGTSVVADAHHQWVTTTRASRRASGERRPPSFYWSAESRGRLAEASRRASTTPDVLVCRGEVLDEVGAEFLPAFNAAAKTVSRRGREPRYAVGPKRQFLHSEVVYSKRDVLAALTARTSTPVGSWAAADHSAVKTTEDIAASVRCADGRANHAVAVAQPLALPARDLPLDPYLLGAWLGDGDTSDAMITSADPEVLDRIRAAGYEVRRRGDSIRFRIMVPNFLVTPEGRLCEVCGAAFVPASTAVRTCGTSCGGRLPQNGGRHEAPTCRRCGGPHTSGYGWCPSCRESHGSVKAILRTMGLLGQKHIPGGYLRASEEQRRDLLAGLLDTDGFAGPHGLVQFAVTSRRLASDVLELVRSLGYKPSFTSKPVNGRSESSSVCYTVGFTTNERVFGLSRKDARRPASVGVRNGYRFITDVVPLESVPVRCVEVDNEDHLYLAGEGMIPTHNSTLGLDIVRSASIRHNLASVIFSLEMSKTEITMRLLSAEAGIQLQHMRKGTMREEDWTRLASTMGRVSEAPLFIDDSPNMSLMEIRAKCRRLKQRDNLKLVVIDYLQLMSSGKRVESRQQEVSEFSRALKLLAKELEVPVVAISQLNRGPEQRTDKKPQMSDLRESGCLTAETRVLRADTGAEVSMGELLATGETDVPVWSLDESLRYVRRHLTHVFSTGTRPVFRLTLSSGKQVRATENHPFLTYAGWRALGDLRTGDRLAVPRHVPAPESFDPWADEKVILLAHMLGDGSMLPTRPVGCASVDEENLTAVSAEAVSFGVVPVRDAYPVAVCNEVLGSHEKFVPDGVFHVSKRQIALFLRHIWATHGSVTVNTSGCGGRISYASTSRRLVDDLSRLLLRFGISTRIRTTREAGHRDGYTLDISGADSQRRFLQEIGVDGSRGVAAERLLAIVRDTKGNKDVDTVPVQVWETVRSVMAERDVPTPGFQKAVGVQYTGSAICRQAPSRDRLGRVAAVLDSAELELYAVNDVLWDEVVSVEPDGVEEVFDATVVGGHNFVANGIAVHNSIEQDADMVILLHREEAYERESPRAGEADLIVAKHRNGPTDTIVLAFQGHYSRFTNMAPSF